MELEPEKPKKEFSLTDLEVVPGFYEPIFDLDRLPELADYFDNKQKSKQENDVNLKRFVERELRRAAEVTFGQSKTKDKDKIVGKVTANPSNLGESLLLNEMRADPLRYDLTISEKNKPSGAFVAQIKDIHEKHRSNVNYSTQIGNALRTLKDNLDKQPPKAVLNLAPSARNHTYPLHYDTFFSSEGNLQTQLASFFRDYSEPSVSPYNQSSTFLSIKKQSRHYVPEANALVNAINAVQTIATPGVKIMYQGHDVNTPDEQLNQALQDARAELVKKTEGRFTQSHLLRRIDFALEKIAERNQPKPSIGHHM